MVAQLHTPTRPHETTPHVHPPQHFLPKVEGLVQVFTAAHRNFFTPVMAQALREAGQGAPVLIVQFLKGGSHQGVDRPLRLSQHLDWFRCDLPYCLEADRVKPDDIAAVQSLWLHTQAKVLEGYYELVVLDELSLAIAWGLISETEVLALLRKRPRHVEVMLTGPEMPKALLDRADQVTELRYTQR
jgi:cob(I)alamin adenosyltransferase